MAHVRSNNDDKTMASYLFTISSSDRSNQGIGGDFHCHKIDDKIVIRKGSAGKALVLVPRTKNGKSLICRKHYWKKCCASPVIVNYPITKTKMAKALKRFTGNCVYKKGFAITGDDGFEEGEEETKRKTEKRVETRKRTKKEEETHAKELIISGSNGSHPLTRAMAKRAMDVVNQPAKKNISNTPPAVAQAAVIIPGDIQTQPGKRIVFNGPYDVKQATNLMIINTSPRRIGWAIEMTNTTRHEAHPACGVLDPRETTLVNISCDKIAFGQDWYWGAADIFPLEDMNNDRITIEWTNTPDGAAKKFRHHWLEADGITRRKNLFIEYNP